MPILCHNFDWGGGLHSLFQFVGLLTYCNLGEGGHHLFQCGGGGHHLFQFFPKMFQPVALHTFFWNSPYLICLQVVLLNFYHVYSPGFRFGWDNTQLETQERHQGLHGGVNQTLLWTNNYAAQNMVGTVPLDDDGTVRVSRSIPCEVFLCGNDEDATIWKLSSAKSSWTTSLIFMRTIKTAFTMNIPMS